MTLIFNKGNSGPAVTCTVYRLVEIADGWKLQNFIGQHFTPRGRYQFASFSGHIRVSKRGEHIHITSGQPVEYAGEICFGYDKVRGKMIYWTNASGHYMPPASLAMQAGLPLTFFKVFV